MPTRPVPARLRRGTLAAGLALLLAALAAAPGAALAQNAIVTENLLTGAPASEWDVSGAGDASLQGFATDISVDRGQTVHFKIRTDAAAYHVEIYRLGWYQGLGARHVGSGAITATLPQSQPADLHDGATGLTDCGNWAESAHWDVPADAVSGIYLARLTRDDTGGASHIVFVVRDDASTSDLLVQTSDATWQAYNVYGGNSLYVGTTSYPSGHATQVSYNRPFVTRAGGGGGGEAEDWLFNAEYPMLRWLEANGYDVSYTTDLDSDRRGALIRNHRVFLSVGHDEYWSAAQRANVLAARDAGVNLAFFSGNEVYWKTRWEPSTDGTDTPYRTLVCYKEGTLGENACGGKCDPLADTWTGLWRDGCAFSPPADGCAPENALSGQISWDGTTGAIEVPDTYGALRLWRNTSVATLGAGQTATFTAGTLGYEWDWEQYPASYPAGRILLSRTTQDGHTHHLSLYRAASGALVFGAGTVQWSWGLDATHDRGNDPPTPAMQQATVNLLADMGAQPATLQGGLVAAAASSDHTAPVSVLAAPLAGAQLPSGTPVVIAGTASDAGGTLAGVEVSVDGGATWQPATGTTAWTFAWTPAAQGAVTLLSRGVDDSGNLEAAGTAPAPNAVAVTVIAPGPANCPCTIFQPTDAPPVANDVAALELGVKFRASTGGQITALRFYKGAQNTGTHTGHLWASDGTLLAEATFTGESASGWQQVALSPPVTIEANTTYIASYHTDTGYYAFSDPYFTQATVNGPLRALANGEDGPNAVYKYGATPAFPTDNYQSSNYWVDVVFENGPDTTPPTVVAEAPANGAAGVAVATAVSATFSEPLDPASVGATTFELRDAGAAPVPATVAYDAATRTATLSPGTTLAFTTAYTATLKGGAGAPHVTDLAGNPLAADVSWTFTTAGPDLTPPSVTVTAPAAGATGVGVGATVSATFDEALTPATVNTTTFELRDAADATVPATVSYNVYTHTAVLAPTAALSGGATYTARLHGGAADPRIKDAAGNALAADVTWTFTTGSGYACPCTVFQGTEVPANPSVTDNQAIEVGMKFRSTLAGYATGVRFYKGALNTGTHVGHLWSAAGQLLAEATFAGETASGWQEVAFAAPVPLVAGTTYIVSYHSPGYFADTAPYFTAAVVNGPLRGLADGEDGPNGVYAYGGESGFPASSANQSNYWVDVVFATTVAPDVTPPTVLSSVPAAGAADVSVTAPLSVRFSESIDPATVGTTTVQLLDAGSQPVTAGVAYDLGTRTASLTPTAALAYASAYTLHVRGGTTDPRIKDLAGNPLAADYSAAFTTAGPPPPPPTEGPGGPILVISAAANPFSRYLVEILRAEGLNEFTAMDASQVDATVLAAHDVVILGEQALSAAQVTMLSDWVAAGGTLIAMRPDKQLAGLLGLTDAGATLANRYLRMDTTAGPGAGLVGQTIQYHGAADLYTLSGATAVATLYSDAATATAWPAVTTRGVGTNGGRALAFTYDLARSVVYTRQGNPAWVGQKRDGQIPPIRSDDQFFGDAAGDPQPDWIDLAKVAIPQADEQQRLLANAILQDNLHRKPLPRFWYLPKGLKAAIVETGDDHGDAGMQPRFDLYRQASPAGCSVADWECVRATGYLYVGSTFTDAQALTYHDLGFEVALHVNTNCANFTQAEYDALITSQLAAFHTAFPSLPLPVTNRNHCIAWSGWSMTAEVEAAHGIRLDTNYYYWPAAWVQDRAGMFTGSGFPMRFAKLDGTIVDCYQAATEMPDESGETFPGFCDQLLTRATGSEGYYGVFTTNMHFDTPNHPGSNAIVASAQAHGVPVVSAKQMLDWLDARNGSSFGALAWGGGVLGFTIVAPATDEQALLPAASGAGTLASLTLNGAPVAFTRETLKGIEYAAFPATAGTYAATYAADVTPPAISAVTATPHADGTATVTWTTDEPADSRVDYGPAASGLTLSASDAALVTAHTVTLSGLTASTAYVGRVTSKDAAGNAATSPAPPAAPLGFTTPAPLCFVDQTAADFALGATGANTAVAQTADGEVILAPALDAEFSGAVLPAGWTSGVWTSGGAATVGGGVLGVNGANATSTATFSPGRSLEFVATFQSDAFENVGFTADAAFDAPWATFGIAPAAGGLYARASDGTNTLISAGLLGAPHRYRIDWTTAGFAFWVDDAQVATIPLATSQSLVVNVSDYNTNAATLTVDWLRVSPFASAGSFLSRVHDGGGATDWGAMEWTAALPAGTSVRMYARRGGTPTPDGTWGAFTEVGSSGATVGGNSRYLQYRADLATTDPAQSPALQDVHVACVAGADVTPPAISAVTASPNAGGTGAVIAWTTDEAATSRVDYGTSPAALTLNAVDPALVATHAVTLSGLSPGHTYHYRVTSADDAGNASVAPAGASAPLTFKTPAQTCFTDQTAADFALGTPDGDAWLATMADGEVMLRPAAGAEFALVPSTGDWQSFPWLSGGGSSVSGGLLTVDAARFNTEPASLTFGPGASLECVATFGAGPFQHVGFGGGNDVAPGEIFNTAPWAIFSTGSGGGAVMARVWDGGAFLDTTLSVSLLGAPHRYRIDWRATSVDFSVDGALQHREPIVMTTPMRVAISDSPLGGPVVAVDWIHVSPYPAAGSFLSRVHDAGASASWSTMTWTADTPAGTSVAMAVRRGDTPTPDGTWSAFAPVAASGSGVGGTSRYLQYRADLATSDPAQTPVLRDVSVACTACGAPLAAVSGLSLARAATPGPGGTLPLVVTFTPPSGAASVEVYRAPFGGYPRYDKAGGTPPPTPGYPPAAPWTLTAVTASGQADAPGARDVWHYVAFATDGCGNASPPSAVALAPDYLLGDVHDGHTDCAGNGTVNTSDVSYLAAHYGEAVGAESTFACLDVGPTSDGSVNGRPLVDGILQFEDLVMFALDYGVASAPRAAARPATAVAAGAAAVERLALEAPDAVAAGDEFQVALRLSGSGRAWALSATLGWDPAVAQPVAVQSGSLLDALGGVALSPRPGTVDVAVLGAGGGLAGDGVVARVTFHATTAGRPALSLARADARDAANHPVPIALAAAVEAPRPTATALGPAAPNPFRERAALSFDLSRAGPVELAVFAVDGRRVRTLVREARAAGRYRLEWDGRDDQGAAVRSGLYFARLVTDEGRFSRALVRVR